MLCIQSSLSNKDETYSLQTTVLLKNLSLFQKNYFSQSIHTYSPAKNKKRRLGNFEQLVFLYRKKTIYRLLFKHEGTTIFSHLVLVRFTFVFHTPFPCALTYPGRGVYFQHSPPLRAFLLPVQLPSQYS